MQEIGRCGRDGGQSSAVLYYHGHQMQHTDAMMKAYVHNSSSCRRDLLLSVFGASSVPPRVQHKCCDICAKTCGCCDTEHCSGVMQPMLAGLSGSVDSSLKPNRSVSLTKMKLLEMALYAYKHRGEEMFIQQWRIQDFLNGGAMVVGKWYTKKARSYNTSNIKALFCLICIEVECSNYLSTRRQGIFMLRGCI